MISIMITNFERFGDLLSIDVMRSSISNDNFFCYIAPVVKNEIGKINIVCEGFVISEIHDAYIFTLESLFKMSPSRTKENVYTIVSDEFLIQPILDSMNMNNILIFTIIII